MEAFTHELAFGIEHHTAHHRVGAGAALAQDRQLQGALHPGAPARGLLSRGLQGGGWAQAASAPPAASVQAGRLRHSATT